MPETKRFVVYVYTDDGEEPDVHTKDVEDALKVGLPPDVDVEVQEEDAS